MEIQKLDISKKWCRGIACFRDFVKFVHTFTMIGITYKNVNREIFCISETCLWQWTMLVIHGQFTLSSDIIRVADSEEWKEKEKTYSWAFLDLVFCLGCALFCFCRNIFYFEVNERIRLSFILFLDQDFFY